MSAPATQAQTKTQHAYARWPARERRGDWDGTLGTERPGQRARDKTLGATRLGRSDRNDAQNRMPGTARPGAHALDQTLKPAPTSAPPTARSRTRARARLRVSNEQTRRSRRNRRVRNPVSSGPRNAGPPSLSRPVSRPPWKAQIPAASPRAAERAHPCGGDGAS